MPSGNDLAVSQRSGMSAGRVRLCMRAVFSAKLVTRAGGEGDRMGGGVRLADGWRGPNENL